MIDVQRKIERAKSEMLAMKLRGEKSDTAKVFFLLEKRGINPSSLISLSDFPYLEKLNSHRYLVGSKLWHLILKKPNRLKFIVYTKDKKWYRVIVKIPEDIDEFLKFYKDFVTLRMVVELEKEKRRKERRSGTQVPVEENT
jgi:hypothetical protein